MRNARIPRWRAHALFLVVALLAGLTISLIPTSSAHGSTQENPNACSVSLSPDPFELPFTLTGTATPDPVDVGDPGAISLTATLDAFFPGNFINSGILIGALSPGDTIPADVTVEIIGDNTDEGTFSDTQSTVLGPITLTNPDDEFDPETNPALPASATVPLSGSTWTASSAGAVEFRQGDLTMTVDLGFPNSIPVPCSPGTVDPVTLDVTPITAAPYATTNAEGEGNGTTTTTGGTTTTTGGTTTTTGASTTTTTEASTTTTTTGEEPDSVTGTETYAASCTTSLAPDPFELSFEITGTVPGEVTAGETFVLSDQVWKVAIPGSVLQAGIGLGLIQAGDTVPGTVDATVFATNTVEATQTAAGIPVEFGPVEVGGDGQALDASSTFEPDDLTFTAVGGDAAIEMSGASVEVDLGLPSPIPLECTPTTSGVAFVTATVVGESDLVAGTTTTTGPGGGPDPTVAGTQVGGGGDGTDVGGTSGTAGTSGGSGGATLPLTGPGSWIAMVIFALVAIDLGYLLWSATKPVRRRNLARY